MQAKGQKDMTKVRDAFRYCRNGPESAIDNYKDSLVFLLSSLHRCCWLRPINSKIDRGIHTHITLLTIKILGN
jgi:hypothetical protein